MVIVVNSSLQDVGSAACRRGSRQISPLSVDAHSNATIQLNRS
jgi:hypothetical protein